MSAESIAGSPDGPCFWRIQAMSTDVSRALRPSGSQASLCHCLFYYSFASIKFLAVARTVCSARARCFSGASLLGLPSCALSTLFCYGFAFTKSLAVARTVFRRELVASRGHSSCRSLFFRGMLPRTPFLLSALFTTASLCLWEWHAVFGNTVDAGVWVASLGAPNSDSAFNFESNFNYE